MSDDDNHNQSDIPPINKTPDVDLDSEVLRTVPESFAIDCANHANWLIRKVVEARQYGERVRIWAEQEQRRAEREENTLMFLFGRQLENWAKAEIEKLNRKSLSLPAGTIAFRRVGASLQVDDEQAVLAWAKTHCPSAVVVAETLSRSSLKDHVEATGEMPDTGAHIEPARESFSIR